MLWRLTGEKNEGFRKIFGRILPRKAPIGRCDREGFAC